METPRYDEKDKIEIIRKKNPLAQAPKGSPLHSKLHEFCRKVKVIVHTVNNNEKWAMLDHLDPPILSPGKALTGRAIDLYETNWIVLGMFGGYKCALIQTEMGSDSRNEIEDVLHVFPKAKFILAIGIAYASNPQKAKLGDVLVSNFIDGVGNIKYKEDGLIIFRAGSTRFTNVSQPLKNVFARGEETWMALEPFECTKGSDSEGGRISRVHSGVMISNRALVNKEDVRENMTRNAPEAIGGEMEGVVLVEVQQSLTRRRHAPSRELGITVIKGVADYADGLKGKEWQLTAAMAAANYARHKLKKTEGKLFTEGCDQADNTSTHGSGVIRKIWHLIMVTVLIAILYQQTTHSILIDSVVQSVDMFAVLLPESLHHSCIIPPPGPKQFPLPKLHVNFVGRESNMSSLERVLLSDSVHVLNINGPPGFGKSTLANKLGWAMRRNCFVVGYIDLEEEYDILPYIVMAFMERLGSWRQPPSPESIDKTALLLVRDGFEWFKDRAVLILDNSDRVLNHKENRKDLLKALEVMIQFNEKGKIILTSEEKADLASTLYWDYDFTIGNLSVEASIKLLRYSSNVSPHEAREIALAVENCPIALCLISRLLQDENSTEVLQKLNDRKKSLKLLDSTEHKHLNFVSAMDVATSFLEIKERVSAMFLSFFPGHFPGATAVNIMFLSDERYNLYAGIRNHEDALVSIKELKRRSLLVSSSFDDATRYKMHRLIRFYFMNKGEDYNIGIEADFNNSFRIYFSSLNVRRQSPEEIMETRARLESEILSGYDMSSFDYLIEMLLSKFRFHIFSDDELIYLAFALNKGLIQFDYSYFTTLLKLFTYQHPHLAVLPNADMTVEDIYTVASDFDNFFIRVLCNVTSHDVCINVYLDILYRLYEADDCSERFEDNMNASSCSMVNCDYANDYLKILNSINAFRKCSDAKFCNLMFNVQYLCFTFDLLKLPLQYLLLIFFLFYCGCSSLMFMTCFKVKKVPLFFCKHFGYLIIIYLFCIILTYTLSIRRYVGLYLDAPLEVHVRNVFFAIISIFYISFVFYKLIFDFVQYVKCELCSLIM